MGLKDGLNKGARSIVRKRMLFEFLSVFFAVISAYGLKNWYDYRSNSYAEEKMLMEIDNGLSADIKDLKSNVYGHNSGLRACKIWNGILLDKPYKGDSLQEFYSLLTRDFINIQNIAGYATLKSKGLELIGNDKLRKEVISLYENDYNAMRKFEEEYAEMQFYESYFSILNSILAPQFTFSNSGNIDGINYPLTISDSERKILRSIILKIYSNRIFILQYYKQLEYKQKHLQNSIQSELGE